MKTSSLLYLISFFLLILIACSEDDDNEAPANPDPCADVNCQNGGTCVDGQCNCLEGFIGPFCETRDPCADINCLNGGVCIDGICDCPPRYTGVNCQEENTASSIILKKVILRNWPSTDFGANWDEPACGAAAADLYITLSNNQGFSYTSEVYPNATAGTEYTFSQGLPLSSDQPEGSFQFRIFDQDSAACAPDDEMVFGQGAIYFDQNGLPDSARFTNNNYQVDFFIDYGFD